MVKGKIFDTRFGLIHVQTGRKIFGLRTFPPRQQLREKILTPDLELILVQPGKKFFC